MFASVPAASRAAGPGNTMALVHKVGWVADFARRNPWFWPIELVARRFETRRHWPTREDLAALYAERASRVGAPPLRFAENVRKRDKRADGRVALEALYDARIALRGEVPTRECDWHDFFNALCFATFPRAKHALHARQYAALAARVRPEDTRMPGARTREQDALTLFDEGGAVIVATAEAAQALVVPGADHDTAAALERAGVARVVPFGHALFEHLVEGLRCPGGLTHIEVVDAIPRDDQALLDFVDHALARALADPRSFASPRQGAPVRLAALGLAPGLSGAQRAEPRRRRASTSSAASAASTESAPVAPRE